MLHSCAFGLHVSFSFLFFLYFVQQKPFMGTYRNLRTSEHLFPPTNSLRGEFTVQPSLAWLPQDIFTGDTAPWFDTNFTSFLTRAPLDFSQALHKVSHQICFTNPIALILTLKLRHGHSFSSRDCFQLMNANQTSVDSSIL